VAAAVAAGCDSETAAPGRSLTITGPPGVVRVALTNFRWPLDPALAEGRDELTLARTLYSTPLRTDPVTGAVLPGLCTAWEASSDFRQWTFTCRSAPSIAAALRRVVRLDTPARWLFVDAQASAPSATSLVVRLPFAWRRFPYTLTSVAAAPRFVPGPFELVSGTKRLVVARRAGLTVQFRRLAPRAASREFRQGKLDEAPVPLGGIAAAKLDPLISPAVRTQRLLGLDVVSMGPVGTGYRLQRAYRDTANRGDYEALISETSGSAAHGFLGGEKANPARFRRALDDISSLPRRRVRIFVAPEPALRAGARLLYAQWRDVGLGPSLSTEPRLPPHANLIRLLAAYPQQEAIPAELVLRLELKPREPLLRALGATAQHRDLERVNDGLWVSARAIPISWVVDARLVSPRLQGWREDLLGNVDYAAVKFRASSRRP
jgi:hypothetical protein